MQSLGRDAHRAQRLTVCCTSPSLHDTALRLHRMWTRALSAFAAGAFFRGQLFSFLFSVKTRQPPAAVGCPSSAVQSCAYTELATGRSDWSFFYFKKILSATLTLDSTTHCLRSSGMARILIPFPVPSFCRRFWF